LISIGSVNSKIKESGNESIVAGNEKYLEVLGVE